MLQKLRDPSVRKKYFEKDLMAFILWYFPESVTYAFSDYHKMYIRSLELGHNTFNKTFRKWGATVLAKYFIIWVIVYKKFRYIVYVSADKNSSSAKLFDIAIQLQTNRRLVADYGQLYFDDDYSKGNKKKTQNLFITENSIKVQSMSIKTSLR